MSLWGLGEADRLLAPILHHLSSTIPNETHTGSESLGHEPWEAVTIAIVGMVGSTIAAFFAYLGHSRAREARTAVEAATKQIDTSVGIPNGHGTVMNQLGVMMNNQMRDSNALTDHITTADQKLERIHQRLDQVEHKLDGHVNWEMSLGQKYTIIPKEDP